MQTSGELYEAFRSDVDDTVASYLWSDTEVYNYMNDAYRMFARLTGGIPDTTSALTKVPVVSGEMHATVSPLILKFEQAYLESTGREVVILNQRDVGKMLRSDYGIQAPLVMDASTGPVGYMVIGLGRDKKGGLVRWVKVPVASDTVNLSVFRLPLDTIDEADDMFEFPDIGEEHVEHLLTWMKSRAYGKQDAEVFDKSKRDHYKRLFEEYCGMAKAEWDRYKHKERVVAYGGIL